VIGEPRAIAEHVGGSTNFYGPFSTSATGVLAYANAGFRSQLVWFDRQGERRPAARDGGGYVDFDLSAGDAIAAVAEIDPASDRSDIYLLDLARGTRERMTSARETDASPVWSPDGSRLVFRSNRERVHDLYLRAVHGSVPEAIFLRSPLHKYPTSWSPDGRSVLFHAKDGTQWDVWVAPVLAPETAHRFRETPFNEVQAQISPDGRTIAYTSNESAALEVYVESLDGKGRRWLTSAGGGSDPKWSPRGNELYYLAPTGSLMAVTVPAGAVTEPGAPHRLFQAPAPTVAEPFTSIYDVSQDGSRFLFRVPLEDVRTEPLRVQLGSAAATEP
jgi:dipeptidyl aminopeptidase/acylaminoacyl peptidase